MRAPSLLALVLSLILATAAVAADDALSGRYTGGFVVPGPLGDTPIGVTLVITSVTGDAVDGRVQYNSRGPCAGEYVMQGTVEGTELRMKSTQKGGRAGDCSFSFKVAVEGNRLVGTTGSGRALRLAK